MAGKRSIGSLFAKQEVVNRRTRMKKGERTAVRTVLGTHSNLFSDVFWGAKISSSWHIYRYIGNQTTL
jgi:hypothetical protein